MTNLRIYQSLTELSAVDLPSLRLLNALLETSSVGSPQWRLQSVFLEISASMAAAPMIPTTVFPALISANGAAWPVHRRPLFSTRVAGAVSGREVRSPYYTWPIYEFELTFPQLNSGSAAMGALSAQTLQALQGFFLQQQGQYGGFLFTDPENCQVTGGTLGTGDGTTTNFPLLRKVGGYSEQIQAANAVTNVYVGGVAQAGSGWAVVNGNEISFQTAPSAGEVVGADFTYYFVCRFLDDLHDYEEFLYQVHRLQSCKLRTVRTS